MLIVVCVVFVSDVPNAGEGLKRLSFKQEWDRDLREFMKKLDAEKPVILCGDLNVAHQEIGEFGAIKTSKLFTALNVLHLSRFKESQDKSWYSRLHTRRKERLLTAP